MINENRRTLIHIVITSNSPFLHAIEFLTGFTQNKYPTLVCSSAWQSKQFDRNIINNFLDNHCHNLDI